MRKQILLLWPAFVIAALATTVFFTIFDPAELTLHGQRLFADHLSAYSAFFLVAWLFGALNAAMVMMLEKSSRQLNGRDIPPADPDAYDNN